MSAIICRVCLNDTKLMDLFDDRLTNSEQLRQCVLLATGVEICRDDVVTKFICQYCSDIAVFLYKYRKKALANDKALKELAHQKILEPQTTTNDIIKYNSVLVDLLETEEAAKIETKKSEEKKKIFCSAPAVHPTVIQLIKACPKLKVPNDLLKCDIQPKLVLDKREAENWKPRPPKPRSKTSEIRGPINDMELFKLKCPGIQIMKITHSKENQDYDVEMSSHKSTETLQSMESRNLDISPKNKLVKVPQTIESTNHNIDIPQCKSENVPQRPDIKDHVEVSRPKAIKLSQSTEVKNHNVEMSRNRPTKISQVIEVKNPDIERIEIKDPNIEKCRSKSTKTSQGAENVDSKPLLKYINLVPNTKKTDTVEIVDSSSNKRRKSSESSTDAKKRKANDQKPSVFETKTKSNKKRTYPPATVGSAYKQDQSFRTLSGKPNSEQSFSKENIVDSVEKIFTTAAGLAGTNQSKEIKTSVVETCNTNAAPVLSAPIILEANAQQNKPPNLLSEDECERIQPKKLNRNNIFESESDNESTYNDAFMEALLDTVEEEILLHCSYCNKMFNTEHSLKCHERTHRNCTICKGIFRSEEALRCHQYEICFKTVIANPPNLQLTRVDEQPEIKRRFPRAFAREREKNSLSVVATTSGSGQDILCISDDEEDDVIFVQDKPEAKVVESVAENEEYQQICGIFKKYRTVKFPVCSKNRSIMTKPQVLVKYNLKNQIVLENMYPELKSYRVPVELIAKPNAFACISSNKKPKPKEKKYSWEREPVILLSKKRLLSVLLSAPTAQANTSVTNNTVTISGNNAVEQFTVVPAGTLPVILSTQEVPAVPSSDAQKNIMVEPVSFSLINTFNQSIENKRQQETSALTNESISVKTVDKINDSAVVPVPTTAPPTSDASQSNAAQPPKEPAFSLRVKTPWELNTI